jgi:hypothetical protein
MKQLTQSKQKTLLTSQWKTAILWPFLAITAFFFIGTASIQAHESKIINETTGIVYEDLGVAISAANSGDTLKIKGQFTGNFTITQNLNLHGGHDAVLNGNKTGPVLSISGSTTNVIIEHLSLTNGSSDTGGGIYNNGANVVLRHVDINQNSAAFGGGIYNFQGTTSVYSSKIENNAALGAGGGIASITGINVVESTTISYNTSTLGGGVYNVDASNSSYKHVKSEGNFASQSGGAFYNNVGSVVTFDDSKLHENSALQFGGGLYNFDTSVANFTHSKVTKNVVQTANGGGGIYNASGASFTLTHSDVDHNTPNDITEG